MTDQLDLLAWGAENPQATTPDLPKAHIAPKPPRHDYQAGEIVLIAPLSGDRPFFAAGPIVGINDDLISVQIDQHEPYRCTHTRLTRYPGVISLWRLGAATHCERPDCEPHQSARPFNCQTCDRRSQSHWWYVGEMSVEQRSPRWPDAMWFPSGYDPNTKEFDA